MLQIPEDDVKILDFMAGLYPNGRYYNEIVKDTVQRSGMSETEGRRYCDGLLKDLIDDKGLCSKYKRRSIDNDEVVILTENGRKKVSAFLDLLFKKMPDKFFTYIKKWMRMGDEKARQIYKMKSLELVKKIPLITEMLIIPQYEDVFLKHYSEKIVKRALDRNDEKKVLDYIAQLVQLGFIEEDTAPLDNKMLRAFETTAEGVSALKFAYEEKEELMQQSHPQQKNNIIKKILPSSSNLKEYLIALLLTIILMLSLSTSIPSLLGLSIAFPLINIFIYNFFLSILPKIIKWAQKKKKP